MLPLYFLPNYWKSRLRGNQASEQQTRTLNATAPVSEREREKEQTENAPLKIQVKNTRLRTQVVSHLENFHFSEQYDILQILDNNYEQKTGLEQA